MNTLLIAALTCAAGAMAQEVTVRSSSDAATAINGIAPVGDGTAYVVSLDARLYHVDLSDFSSSVLIEGLPLSAPGGAGFVELHPWLDDGLLIVDWNSEDDGVCCDGRTWLMDVDTLDFKTLAEGTPDAIVGDPVGVAVAPGGDWGDDVFVIDFQGAAVDPPVLFRIGEKGPASFLQDGDLWATNDQPTDLAFDVAGDYGGDLFVIESLSGGDPEKIARVTPDALWDVFLQDAALGDPRGIAFGGGGDFGDDMYVLFEQPLGNGVIHRISPDAEAEFVVDGLCDGNLGGLWSLRYDPSLDALLAGTGDAMHVVSFGDAGCYPDCNADGVLNILDFVCFQAAFLDGAIEADCNRDCVFSILDFVCFQSRFVAGCD